jgi:single-strand DNA-binding protein
MSNGTNRVTLFGNLGADPELRVTQGGQMVLRLRVATNEAYYDKEHKLIERTDWHDVVVFGSRAEGLARILTKGEALFVYGSIRYSNYEKEGVMRYRTEIIARDVGLSGKAKRGLSAPPRVTLPSEEPTLEHPYGLPNSASSSDAIDAASGPIQEVKPLEEGVAAGEPAEATEASDPLATSGSSPAVDFPKKRRRTESVSHATV